MSSSVEDTPEVGYWPEWPSGKSLEYVHTLTSLRMMTFLRLHMFDETPHPTMKPLLGAESLRRLAWSVYYLDATIDGGNYGFTAIPDGAFTISLPCDEKPFLQHLPTTKEYMLPTIPPAPDCDLGLAGYLLRAMYARQILAGLHSRIQRRLVPVSSILDFVTQAANEASQLLGTLPFDMLYTRTNFHILKSQQPLFLHLHVMRNTCARHIALLKMLTTTHTTSDHFDVSMCRRQLIEDASALSGFFSQALDHGTVLDPQLAMHAYNGLESESTAEFMANADVVSLVVSTDQVLERWPGIYYLADRSRSASSSAFARDPRDCSGERAGSPFGKPSTRGEIQRMLIFSIRKR